MKKSDWKSVIDDYHQRDCTQKEFCEGRGINPATLQYHLRSWKEPKGFVPIESFSCSMERIVLEFPSGLKLSIDAR